MRKQTIGEVADLVGVDVETIRYYERIGLTISPSRTRGGHRLYQNANIQRLRFIRRARDVGFSIEDIRALIEIEKDERRCCSDVRDIAVSNLEKIRAKRAELERMEQVLAQAASACTADDSPLCSILDYLNGAHDAATAPG